MKKLFILLNIIFMGAIVFPQISVRGGMGINFISTPTLRDYLNDGHFAPINNQVATFNTAINFSGEVDFRAAQSYELGVEVAYLYNSFTYSPSGGRYELSYSNVMPTIVNYYVIDGQGYNFKFGGGLGLRFASINELREFTQNSNNYSSVGFGILLRAMGNTSLGGNVYANITGDIRYDLNGTPKNNGNPILDPTFGNNVNLNSLSVGISLGITYIF
ncbi:MAG: hypothetical protein P4L35_15685 [Ignavibacteriaceae bacterium]|nr:hypothetical protein [Ignavibacteriaceae bacterium]